MSSVNISLPNSQVTLIDKLIDRYGFANRSEFFRSLLRLVVHKPEIIGKATEFPFIPTPAHQSVKEIISDFRKTKKYSKEFLQDLKQGLRESKYFKP